MYINISEIIRLKGRLSDIKLNIKNTLEGVSRELTDVNYNIRSSDLIQSNERISNKIVDLSQTLDTCLDVLVQFLTQQMDSYQLTNEETKGVLDGLVNLINGTFDEDGNIIQKVSKSAISSSYAVNSAYGVDTSVYTSKPECGFVVTTGNKTYDLSDSDRDIIYGVVSAECDKSYDDALAVASVILNRCESPSWSAEFGSNPVGQVTAKNQFVVYQKGYYRSYMGENVPDTVRKAVDDALNGVRNCNYMSFRSGGTTSYSNNRVSPSGNRYK